MSDEKEILELLGNMKKQLDRIEQKIETKTTIERAAPKPKNKDGLRSVIEELLIISNLIN